MKAEINSWPGKYHILKSLEQGGMCEIFLAEDSKSQQVILKKLFPQFSYDKAFIHLLESEYKTLRLLKHPGIPQVYDFFSEGENHYLVEEYIEGPTLRKIIDTLFEKQKTLSLALSLNLTLQLVEILTYVHSAQDATGINLGLIHSDLNPRNMILTSTGDLKLLDFSIAQTRENHMGSAEGVGRAIISYMSPEQASSKGIDARSDIFGVGILLHEFLTGDTPFPGDSRFEVMVNLMTKELKVETLSSKLLPVQNILLRCLEKKPSERYSSMIELKADLIALMKREKVESEKKDLELFLKTFNT